MTSMNELQMKVLKARGYTYDTVFSNGRYEDIKTRLLDKEGVAVILVYDIDSCHRKLVDEGVFFGQNFTLDHEYKGFWLDDVGIWRWCHIQAGNQARGLVKEFYGIKAE